MTSFIVLFCLLIVIIAIMIVVIYEMDKPKVHPCKACVLRGKCYQLATCPLYSKYKNRFWR